MKEPRKEALRVAIRELLAKELAALRGKGTRQQEDLSGGDIKGDIKEESVAVSTGEELTAFAQRICALARDSRTREAIESGRWRFSPRGSGAAREDGAVRFEKGVVGEREISSLREETCIRVGKRVCFTPLALDEVRRRRIRIEREK